ncbi:hypothetical protein [Streptococcus suis]|uniref:hypothetical protein n=1 Tax=Streptococcus suis TaxID=1307 RepID=UPI003D10E333
MLLVFLASLPVEKFHGVGKKTVERLHEMGVYTGQDLLDVPEMVLIDRFGAFWLRPLSESEGDV